MKDGGDVRFLVTFHPDLGVKEDRKELEEIKEAGFEGVRTTMDYYPEECQRLGLLQLTEFFIYKYLDRVGPNVWARRVGGGAGKLPYLDHTFCAANPEIIAAGEDAIRQESRKYRDSKVPFAFQIDNEFSYLDIQDTTQYLCYCPSCERNFRAYLQDRFGDISQLNARWQTHYRDWEDIALPIKPLRRPWRKQENLPAWVEFRRYTNQAISNYLCRLSKAAREETDLPVVIAEMNTMFFDCCVHVAQDLYGMSREADVLGLNIGGCDFAQIIDFTRGFGKTIWLTESHIETAVNYSRLMRQRHYSALAHGCRTINFFKSRASYEGIERDMYGISREDGGPIQLYYEVEQITREFKQLAPKLRPTRFYQPKTAIVYSWETMFVNDYFDRTLGIRGLEMPAISALHGAYYATRALHVPVEGLTTDQMAVESFDKYEALILPACIAFPKALADKLLAWIKGGGTLIVDYPFARYDEGGITNPQEPGSGLEAFGIQTEPAAYGRWQFTAGSHAFPAVGEKAKIVKHNGEVLGTFEEGEPAVVLTKVGKGQVIFFAASPAIGMKNYPSSTFPEFVKGFLPAPPVSIDLPPAIARDIDLGLLQADASAILLLVNFNEAPVADIPVQIEAAALPGGKGEVWLYDQEIRNQVQVPTRTVKKEGKEYLLFTLPDLETTRVIEFR